MIAIACYVSFSVSRVAAPLSSPNLVAYILKKSQLQYLVPQTLVSPCPFLVSVWVFTRELALPPTCFLYASFLFLQERAGQRSSTKNEVKSTCNLLAITCGPDMASYVKSKPCSLCRRGCYCSCYCRCRCCYCCHCYRCRCRCRCC